MSKDDDYIAAFREEGHELLADLEVGLLELEERRNDLSLINRIFRAMHTIKGSGAMFGFEDLAVFTHTLESAFDLVRNGKLPVSSELIDLTLQARDHIRAMLDNDPSDEADRDRLVQALQGLSAGPAAAPVAPEAPACPAETAPRFIHRIRFRPHRGLFVSGADPFLVLDDLLALGEAAVECRLDSLPLLAEIDPEACYAWWDIALISDAGQGALDDVFMFVEDSCDLDIHTEVAAGLSARQALAAYPWPGAKAVPARPVRIASQAKGPQRFPIPAHHLTELLRTIDELAAAEPGLRQMARRLGDRGLDSFARLLSQVRDRFVDLSYDYRPHFSAARYSLLGPGPDAASLVTGSWNTLKLDRHELSVLFRYATERLGVVIDTSELPRLTEGLRGMFEEFKCISYSELHYRVMHNRELENRFLDFLAGFRAARCIRELPLDIIRERIFTKAASRLDGPPCRMLLAGSNIWKFAMGLPLLYRAAHPDASASSLAVLALDDAPASVDLAGRNVFRGVDIPHWLEDENVRPLLRRSGDGWALAPSVRRMVVVRQLDFSDPVLAVGEFDLILGGPFCHPGRSGGLPAGFFDRLATVLAPDGLLLAAPDLDPGPGFSGRPADGWSVLSRA